MFILLAIEPGWGRERKGRHQRQIRFDSDTLMAACSQPNDDWGSVGHGAKLGRKARKWWLCM